MAAPAFVAKGTISSGTGSSITPGYGSISPAAGDLLLLLAVSKQLGGSLGSIDTPAGWTLENSGSFQDNASGNVGSAALFYKKATGTETGSVTVSRTGDTGGTHQFSAQIYHFNGFNPYIESVHTYSLGAGNATITWGAVFVGGAERTLAALVANLSSSGVNPPATYTESAIDEVTSGPIEVTLACNTKANVSSDGLVTSTSGASSGWLTFHASIYDRPKGAKTLIYIID